MADEKISGLNAASPFSGAELYEVVQVGLNKKATLVQLYNYLLATGIDTVTARNAAILVLDSSLKGGVPSDGDTLNKLYNLIVNSGTIKHTYANIAALLADQSGQIAGGWYMVQNATTDPTVSSGWAIYMRLNTTSGALSDYQKVLEQEGLDLVVNDASESTKGIIEVASQTETNAGTDDNRAVTPKKLTARLSLNRFVTGNDAIVQADNLAKVYFNSSTDITFTIDQLSVDTTVMLINIGTGNVSFVNGSGVMATGVVSLPGGLDATAMVLYISSTTPKIISGVAGKYSQAGGNRLGTQL